MTLLLDLFFAVLAGFAGHLSRPFLKRHFSGPWLSIACYAVGYSIAVLFSTKMIRRLSDIDDVGDRHVAASLLSGLGVGAGVGIGYWAVGDE